MVDQTRSTERQGARWVERPWEKLQESGQLPPRVCQYFKHRSLRCYELRRHGRGLGYFIDMEAPVAAREGFPTLFRAVVFVLTHTAELALSMIGLVREHENERRSRSAVPQYVSEERGASKPHRPRAADALEPAPAPGAPRRPAPPQ
ncbi:MAG: hypothetical protein U1A78_41540 [Polyangia bacterium]